MIACHLYEIIKSTIDEIIEANDKLLGEIERRINRDFDEYYRKLKNKAKVSRTFVLQTLKNLLTHEKRDSITLVQFCNEIGDEKLNNTIADCEEVEIFDFAGKAKLAKYRYSYLKAYIENFLHFDFYASKGAEVLLKNIKILLQARKHNTILPKVDLGFIETPWKQGLINLQNQLDEKMWELVLFFAVRKALNSGSLYVPQSKNHREFWAPLYKKEDWISSRDSKYEELKLPVAPKLLFNVLKKEWFMHLKSAISSFGPSSFAEFLNHKLKIHEDKPLAVPASLLELQNLVEVHLEPVRIEKLLTDLQHRVNYLRAFKPLEGFDPKLPLQLPIINASITAHTTNLGLYGLSKNSNGISVDKLR